MRRAARCALAGAALLAVPAARYRIDRFACDKSPPWPEAAALWGAYLLAVALLSAGWLWAWRAAREGRLGLRGALLLGAAVHAAALAAPPFLSQDPLAYAATGRALATFGQSAQAPLGAALPPGDPFLRPLPAEWRAQGSTYGPLAHGVSWLIARLAGADLTAALRLHQVAGLLSVLATAAVAGQVGGAAAAALVALCPLAVIEGTVGAHNDGLLALCTALYALCVTRRRSALAAAALAAGVLVKASGVLLLALHLSAGALPRIRRELSLARARAWAPAAVVAAALLLGAALWLAGPLRAYSPATARLLGSVADPCHCIRSVECLPRRVLRHFFRADALAWGVGLLFRLAGALLLLRRADLASRPGGSLLREAGTFLLLYYLYLHAWSWSWYLLPLLPLLPFADGKLLPAMLLLLVVGVAYYPAYLPVECATEPLLIGAVGALDGLLVIVPPTVLLLRARRGAPS